MDNIEQPILSQLSQDSSAETAAYKIQEWFKFIKTTRQLRKKLKSFDFLNLTKVMDACKTCSFEQAQTLVLSELFLKAFSTFLSSIPLDPLLKVARKASSRNPRMLASSLLIRYFPGSTIPLEESGSILGVVATLTHASSVYIHSLKSLLKFLVLPIESKLRLFENLVLSYQRSSRHFLEAFQEWKERDAQRIVQLLQIDYIQCQTMILLAQHTSTTNDRSVDRSLQAAMTNQRDKLNHAIFMVIGSVRAKDLIDELNAQALIQFTAEIEPPLQQEESIPILRSRSANEPQSPIGLSTASAPSKLECDQEPAPTAQAISSTAISTVGTISFSPDDIHAVLAAEAAVVVSAGVTTSFTSHELSTAELRVLERLSRLAGEEDYIYFVYELTYILHPCLL